MARRSLFGAAVFLVLCVTFVDVSAAHPGPVDRFGCHLDGAGRRHCH